MWLTGTRDLYLWPLNLASHFSLPRSRTFFPRAPFSLRSHKPIWSFADFLGLFPESIVPSTTIIAYPQLLTFPRMGEEKPILYCVSRCREGWDPALSHSVPQSFIIIWQIAKAVSILLLSLEEAPLRSVCMVPPVQKGGSFSSPWTWDTLVTGFGQQYVAEVKLCQLWCMIKEEEHVCPPCWYPTPC